MRKHQILGLLVIALSILVIAGCATAAPAPAAAAPAAAPAPAAVEQPLGLVLTGAGNYTVAEGDTLAGIAADRFGGANMYYFPLIRLANAAAVPDPDVIEVGTGLVVPDLQRNLENASATNLIAADMYDTADMYEAQGKPNAAATLRDLATSLSN